VEWWLALALMLSSTLAFAADRLATGTRGSPCCGLLLIALFAQGGVGWLRAVGLFFLPPVVMKSIHEDEDVQAWSRVVAWVWTVLWSLSILCGVGTAVLGAVAGPVLERYVASLPAEVRPGPEAPAPSVGTGRDVGDLEATVLSSPSGARIVVDGVATGGRTPGAATVRVGRKTTLEVQLDGFFSQSRVVEPNLHDKVAVDFTLRPAARFTVTTEPAGATVFVDGVQVLAATPGTTEPFKAGSVTLKVQRDGFLPVEEVVAIEPTLLTRSYTLEACETVRLEGAPVGATVTLDGKDVGVLPMALPLKRDTRHVLTVKRAGWSTWSKTLVRTRSQTFAVELVDLERRRLQARVDQAQKAYDVADAKLAEYQRKNEYWPSPEYKRRVERGEEAMLAATTALEKAQQALADLDERRPHE
jgi:hypothetical protein